MTFQFTRSGVQLEMDLPAHFHSLRFNPVQDLYAVKLFVILRLLQHCECVVVGP